MVRYRSAERYSRPKDAKEMLALAKVKEKAAVAFYQDMLKHSFVQEGGIRDLIEKLKSEELLHIKKIEDRLAQLGE